MMLSFVLANILLFTLVTACIKWAVREERRRNAREGSDVRDN